MLMGAIGVGIVGTLVLVAMYWVWMSFIASKEEDYEGDRLPEMGADSPRGCLNYIIFVVILCVVMGVIIAIAG